MSSYRKFAFALSLLLAMLNALAAGQAKPVGEIQASSEVERIGPLVAAGASDALKQAVEEKGYRIRLDNWSADFWFAKQLNSGTADVPDALYPQLMNGEFVGVVSLPKGMSDFRGQHISAGLYTLRYQLLPQDGNHLGVAPNPDFLLAIPAAGDPNPEQHYLPKKLFALSAKSVGGNHPAVLALASASHPASLVENQNLTILSVAIPSTGTAAVLDLGIVVKGAASQ